MPDTTDLLARSADRLRALAEPLDADQLRASAYPSEWTVADVLSHIGSGAADLDALRATFTGV